MTVKYPLANAGHSLSQTIYCILECIINILWPLLGIVNIPRNCLIKDVFLHGFYKLGGEVIFF